nr:hypothetical protein [Pseudorhodoplanes sinuspersici]
MAPALNHLSLSATADVCALDDVKQFGLVGKQPLKPLDDNAFEISGGDATVRRMSFAATFHERCGHVTISRALLDRPCRRQTLAGLVEEQAGQEAWRLGIGTCCALHAVLGEHGLHGIPEWFVNDRGMLAGIGVALMRSFSAVGPVLKKKINELLPV